MKPNRKIVSILDQSGEARQTFQDCLATDDRPAGFDYLRIVLALLILIDHSVIVCAGTDTQVAIFAGVFRPFVACLVPMFFALSGFLVAGSLLRCRTLASFIA